MASTSQKQKGRALSTLDADIQALNHAKDTRDLSLAQDAFDSASTLLTTIRVRSLLFFSDMLQAHALLRILRSTEKITPSSGSSALMCVKPSTGVWAGDDRMGSATPYSGPSNN